MTSVSLVAKNREFYNALWSRTYLTRPERFNTWPSISRLLPTAPRRLEIGPGLRPRLPIAGTHFIDLSPTVIEQLNAHQGLARPGEITDLPFDRAAFDLVAAFDVIEHVENDARVFEELIRVLAPGGRLLFSVPLYPARWTTFDEYVGHARRYEPVALQQLLASHGLVIEQSGIFGMQSNSPRLLELAVKGLRKHHKIAMVCYNWLIFPLGMALHKRLKVVPGLIDLSRVDEVFLICRRQSTSQS
jgi:SAM-dependent methyltransferase